MTRRALLFTIFGFVCTFSITGCVQKEEYGSSKEIILTHSIDLPTKGNVIEEQNELINSNQEIGVTIIGASAPHNNVKWVSDGLGGLSNTGDAIYYSGTSKAAVFAYHPYNSQWTDVVNQSYTFTVSEDQSGSGFANSDLLWAKASSDCNTPTVQLHFKHLLSKVNLYIADKNGEKVTASDISVKGVEMSTFFSGGEIKSKEGTGKGSVIAGKSTSQATAILVPQTIQSEQPIVCATIDGVEHNLILSAPLQMTGGKSYTFKMTLQENGQLTLGSSSIDPWDDEDVGGDDGDEESSGPQFSETVDLITLIAWMAGTEGFTECHVPSITQSAETFFAPVRNHKAVQLMREYKNTNIAYDAVSAYGNILSFNKDGKLVFNPEYKEGSSDSFDRWTQKQKYDMLNALNDFYKESNFHEWFESTKSLQERAIYSFLSVCNLDYPWFDSYYEKNDKLTTRIVLCFFMGSHNQGISYTKKDGTFFVTPTLGCLSESYGAIRFGGDMNLIVHEFSHPYCNPLIEKYWSSISDKADEIFSFVRSIMSSQAYGSPMTMMCETLVRSCAIRYMMSHGETNMVDWYLENEENNGFMLVRTLVEALDEREKQASKYPTLDSFMPVLIDVINNFDISSQIPSGKYEEYTNFANTVLLPGVFSVGPDKKVRFTRGNLYWDGKGWHLEDNQMNYPTIWDENHIGHFFWAITDEEARQPYYYVNRNSLGDHFFCDGSDENHFLTIEGTSGLRVISGNDNSELLYLLEKRNNAYRLVRDQVEIEGVGQCLVIAPDDYQGSIESKYDPESWAKAEKAGLVCFSPAGIRWDESIGEYKRCQYWTASPHDTSEWHAYGFGVNYHYPSYSSRNAGFPLRLSKDVTN